MPNYLLNTVQILLNVIQILSKFCPNIIQILSKCFPNIVPILSKYYSKQCLYIVQILYKYYPNIVQILSKYHSVNIQILSVSKHFLPNENSADILRYMASYKAHYISGSPIFAEIFSKARNQK